MVAPGCGPGGRQAGDVKWSERMANTIMARWDTLLELDGGRIRWQYDVAFVGEAIDRLGHIDPKYSAYMEDWINFFVREDGTVYRYRIEEFNIDRVRPAKHIITLYKRTGEQRFRDAIELHVEQMRQHPRTNSGVFWHKNIYPYQIWADGLYMAGPFLAQYAKEFNAPEWFDEVTFQITEAYRSLVCDETGLLFHAYDESRQMAWSNPETGHSPHFWSRAMGWYSMALVDVLDYLPQTHPGRDSVITILQNISEALVKVRDPESGLWWQVLDHVGVEGNYAEGSGSAMFAYVFAKGARLGYLDPKFRDIANSTFDAIIERLIVEDPDGHITMNYIVGATGLGGNPFRDGSFEYYISEQIIPNDPKGTAPFILAALELDR